IERGFAQATVAWHELLQSAEDLGIGVPATVTTREAARELAGRLAPPARMRGKGQERDATAAMARLVSTLEREGYGRPGAGASVSRADAALALRGLFRGSSVPARLRAVLLPASLWRRLVRALRGE